MINAVWENWENMGVADSLLVSLVAIIIVFLVLTIIIAVTSIFQKGMDVVQSKTQIMPRKENAILNDDEDAVVAVLVATMDFHKETGKDARVISITRIED